MIKCVQCTDDYEPKSNIINIGSYKVEVYNLDNKTNYNLCEWCLYDLSGNYNEAR